MTTYLSTFIFDLSPPTMEDAESDAIRRTMFSLEHATGPGVAFSDTVFPVVRRTYSFILDGRVEIAAFRSFIFNTAQGRYGKFWIPTYDHDFVLTADIASANTSISVKGSNYSSLIYPLGNYRKHIVIRTASGLIPRNLTSASGTTTETLGFSGAVGSDIAVGAAQISYLLLARLEFDAIEFQWVNPNLALVTLPIIELPMEYP
jgi:hypothetical protein